ncbi:thermonuclease family protein [Candidatus Uhrbacteria bacterium]|nr:thermonuclease family protein [Candidatus Uhrbacteria bacterium]
MKRAVVLIGIAVALFLPSFARAGEIPLQLKGRIVLQVQQHGEAWYVNPTDGKRYFLGRPSSASVIMRELGLGISNKDFDSLKLSAPRRLSGRIVLKTQDVGKAYYVYPPDRTLHYLGRPRDAFRLMRALGLGITDSDLAKIPIGENGKEFLYLVTRAVDGDTLDVSMNGATERVRAIGIDTPEVVDLRKSVQYFGKESSETASKLLLNRTVRLVPDPTQNDRDTYGRLLRYVYRDDGLFFNKWMIENGYAHEYTYIIPYQFQAEFVEAAKVARKQERGLWAPSSLSEEASEMDNSKEQVQQFRGDGHMWYTSSYKTAKFYYCDTDPTWQGLKKENLKTFSSADELLSAYNRTLHKPCL